MSLRADRIATGETQLVSPDVLGGLVTNVPPHRVPLNASPDLDNILLHNGAAQKRGAMVPAIRQQPGVCSLQNRGVHTKSRQTDSLGAVDNDFIVVPGSAHAGHRSVWDDADVRDGITLDFFFTIDDLSPQQGGNGVTTTTPFGPAPYTIRVRPILSKGPLKRTAEGTAGSMPGTDGWRATTRWGPVSADHHAMPFCVYLKSTGTYPNLVWSLCFSFHWREGGVWLIRNIESDLSAIGGVQTGRRYHFVGGYSMATNQVVYRVGSFFDYGTPQYVTITDAVSLGTPGPAALCTTGPVQLFDCPQEFVEAPITSSSTRPPGLGISAAATGGYWFGALRFEGSIEDVVIYRGLVPSLSAGALDRTGRIDPARPVATRLQHWPIESRNDRMVEEVTGTGNHFYLSPASPVFDDISGGIEGGSLAFNGATGHALLEMASVNPVVGDITDGRGGNSNWRTLAFAALPVPIVAGTWEKVVKNQYLHGLEVAFWPESIEPNHEQVIAEAHAAIRVAVDYDGFIVAYTRDTSAYPTAPGYVVLGRSFTRVIPGHRYHVMALRISPTATRLYVNGILEDFRTVSASPATSHPVSGLTVGMGALSVSGLTNDPTGRADQDTPTADQINTDVRTAFLGRIETLRVLVGSTPFSVTQGQFNVEISRRFTKDDYEIAFDRLYTISIGSGVTADDGGTLPNVGAGHVLTSPMIRDLYGQVARPIDTSASPTAYIAQIYRDQLTGVASPVRVELLILRCIGAWDFMDAVPDLGQDNDFTTRVEYRDRTTVNAAKHVHVQRGYTYDLIGLSGQTQLRCGEPDLLTEATANYASAAWLRRNRPYMTAGPRALAPRWRAGMLAAPLGANPIALLAPWQIETTQETVLIAGCRRSLYWCKPRQRRANPFGTGLSLWSGGNRNDHCRARALTPFGLAATWAAHEAVVDCWIKPDRLDGHRMVVMSGTKQSGLLRYLVLLNDGQVEVWGMLANGDTWHWVAGGTQSSPSQNTISTTVGLNRWNHIAVRIASSAVQCWVNGQVVPMVTDVLLGANIATSTIPAATDLWLCGPTADFETMTFTPLSAAARTILLRPFSGQIAYARENSTMALLSVSATTSGTPPLVAPTTRADRWQFDGHVETGWAVLDPARPSLEIAFRELVEIDSDVGDFARTPASHVVFRNRLLVAHPSGRPRAVRFISLSEDEKFRATTLGIVGSHDQLASYQWSESIAFQPLGGATAFDGNEFVEVFCSFVNNAAGGEESELVSLGAKGGPGVPCESVRVYNLPLSDNPDVVARRLYLSVAGALPIFVGEVADNRSRAADIRTKVSLGITTPLPATRLPAFTCSKVAVAQGTVLLAGITENKNVLAASGDLPGHFPIGRIVALDSEDGQGVLGVAGHLGGVFAFKRNGTWQFTVSPTDGLVSASVRLVNASAGCAGGTAIYDNVVYGSNDRGIWMFDGANFAYASPVLEGDWRLVDVSDAGLVAQQGVYLYPSSQFWLSVRRRDQLANTVVYVLHTGSAKGWTRLTLPAHVALARIADSVDRPVVAIGTINGQILLHEDDAGLEGLVDLPHAGGAQTVAGSSTLTTTRTLTDVAAVFDTTHGGLRGVPIELFNATTGDSLGTATIVANTATSLTWDTALGSAALLVTYAIGGHAGNWSSGWLAPQQMGGFLKAEDIDLTFDPRPNLMTLENQCASRALAIAQPFPVATSESRTVDLSAGYLDQPKPTTLVRQGAYFRIRFGSKGPRQPFAVTAFGVRFGPTGTRGKPT